MRQAVAICALVLIMFGSAAEAQPDMAELFGRRPTVESISLSPDGTKLAVVRPMPNEGYALITISLGDDAQEHVAMRSEGGASQLRGCDWISNNRLFCNVVTRLEHQTGTWLDATTIIAVDHDGRNRQIVSERSRDAERVIYDGGRVIDWLPDDNDALLITRNHVPTSSRSREGMSVHRIDTRTLQSQGVETIRDGVNNYITDGHGTVRIMARYPTRNAQGYWRNDWPYLYRRLGSNQWEPLSTFDGETGSGFRPVAVDREANRAYGFDMQDGRQAFFSMALDGSGTKTLIFSHPSVDVDQVIRVGRSRRVVGVSYATEQRHAEYFDASIRRLHQGLRRALPDQSNIWIIDASLNEERLLVFASSDRHAGTYYLYDRPTRHLSPLVSERRELADLLLAEVRAVSIPGAGGVAIPAYLTMPPGASATGLPAIVLPHGGPSARDEWGFDWLAQFYAAKGYAVLQPNFRGSSGYGDAWLSGQGFLQWRTAVGDINDAGRWLVDQGIADADRLAIVGWSYGGYAALQSGVVAPELFKAIVAIAPVTDLPELVSSSRDFVNHYAIREMVGTGASARDASPARRAEAIRAPVMLFHGTQDGNVDVRHSRMMDRALDKTSVRHELVIYDGLDHQLNDSDKRIDLLRRSDSFIRASFGSGGGGGTSGGLGGR